MILLAACGASSSPAALSSSELSLGPPVALRVVEPVFFPGEVLRFDLSLRGIVGGEAVIVVGQPGTLDGQKTIVVRSRSRSAGVARLFKEVRDDVTTWVDLGTGHPIRLHAEVKFGSKEALIETRFARGEPGPFTVKYNRRDRGVRLLRQRMPPHLAAFDGLSVLGVLRAWNAPVGSQSYFYVLAGKRLWHNSMMVTRLERITTPMGRFRARRLEGVAWRLDSHLRRVRNKKARSYVMWISDDDERLPLRIKAKTEYGDVKAELVGRQLGSLQARSP